MLLPPQMPPEALLALHGRTCASLRKHSYSGSDL